MATRMFFYPGPDAGLYAIFRNSTTGTVWTGTVMAAWSDAAIGTYDVPLSFVGGDAYTLTVPTTLPTGQNYTASVYVPSTPGTPAITDTKLPDEWEFRWNGSTAEEAPEPGEAAGDYVDQAYMELVRGEKNIREWSNKDNSSDTTDTAAVQAAIDQAEALINAELKGNYVMPIELGEDATGTLILKGWAETLASTQLYMARGLQDDNAVGDKLRAERDAVMEQIARYVGDSAASSFDFEAVEVHVPYAPLVVY